MQNMGVFYSKYKKKSITLQSFEDTIDDRSAYKKYERNINFKL